jgi:uncharacterized protein with FMN-binding domain
MKRVFLAIAGTVSGLVLLLGFKIHPAAGTGAAADTGTGATAATPAPATSGGTGTPSGASGTRTVTGDTIETRWGPVQVEVTLKGSAITKVRAIQLPNDRARDLEINGFAVPQLEQETMSAQSARIDAISGATYTSDGYTRSLQSALDKAGR